MNFSFISVVSVLNNKNDIDLVGQYLHTLNNTLKGHFRDSEIILVNNTYEADLPDLIKRFEEGLQNNIYLINLSKQIDQNNAMVAGLDQANGDYVVYLETVFYKMPELILSLYQKTQENFDIVYIRSNKKNTVWFRQILLKLFYTILKRNSNLTIDENAFDSRMISRRSINSILKLRENLRYMKAIYALVGYRTSFIEANTAFEQTSTSFSGEIKMYINAITSFTDFLQVLLRWIFIVSILLFFGATTNAFLVKLVKIDLFGNVQKEVTGWAFLVILISLTFSILCLILYIMSIYLSKIYSEIKQRPLYFIESIKRF